MWPGVPQTRFELYRDRGGDWRWRLRHRNGQVIAASGESFDSKRNARDGAGSVKRVAADAPVVEVDDGPADGG